MSNQDSDGEGDRPLVKAEGGITITDIFGIGGVWKSPAARDMVKAMERLIRTGTDPAKIYLEGKARNAVDAGAIISRAKAEAQAALITAESKEALLERAARRLVTEEGIKQANLEATLTAAVEDLEAEAEGVASRALNDDWLLKWMRGAQYASSEQIRRAWSKALNAQSRADRDEVSAASLSLLESLDQSLAEALEEYVRYLAFFGCIPWDVRARPAKLDLSNLSILAELGFFAERSPYDAFPLREFELRAGERGPRRLPLPHGVLSLSQRAFPLVLAIFGSQPFDGPLRGKEPSEVEAVDELCHLVRATWEQGPRPIFLLIKAAGVRIKIAEGTPELRFTASELLKLVPHPSPILTAVVERLVGEYKNIVASRDSE